MFTLFIVCMIFIVEVKGHEVLLCLPFKRRVACVGACRRSGGAAGGCQEAGPGEPARWGSLGRCGPFSNSRRRVELGSFDGRGRGHRNPASHVMRGSACTCGCSRPWEDLDIAVFNSNVANSNNNSNVTKIDN